MYDTCTGTGSLLRAYLIAGGSGIFALLRATGVILLGKRMPLILYQQVQRIYHNNIHNLR